MKPTLLSMLKYLIFRGTYMKLTKQRLKEIIKEELIKENRQFRVWQDHVKNLEKLYISVHWAKKAIPHKKKELKEMEKYLINMKQIAKVIVGQVVDM